MTDRYAKPISLYAQTPIGEIVTRKTDRKYQFVSMAFFSGSRYYRDGWNVVSWHETETAAAKKLSGYPGTITTKYVPVTETEPRMSPLQIDLVLELKQSLLAEYKKAIKDGGGNKYQLRSIRNLQKEINRLGIKRDSMERVSASIETAQTNGIPQTNEQTLEYWYNQREQLNNRIAEIELEIIRLGGHT